jgi:hypothetical protein
MQKRQDTYTKYQDHRSVGPVSQTEHLAPSPVRSSPPPRSDTHRRACYAVFLSLLCSWTLAAAPPAQHFSCQQVCLGSPCISLNQSIPTPLLRCKQHHRAKGGNVVLLCYLLDGYKQMRAAAQSPTALGSPGLSALCPFASPSTSQFPLPALNPTAPQGLQQAILRSSVTC